MNKYTPAKKSEERVAANSPQNNSDFISLIQKFESQMKLALPKHLTPSRMTRIIITEVRKTPLLASCDRASFFGAIITCAQLGLEPGNALGQIYLLPYYNTKQGKHEVQLIVGYQGMIDLIERDGRVTIDAQVVYEKDVFKYTLGTTSEIIHEPYSGEEDPGQVIASYAVARYKDGRTKFRVLRKHEIERAKKASMSGNKGWGPWKDYYAEMAMKTAVRRLFKLLPKNPEMSVVQAIEDKAEIGDTQELDGIYGDFKAENKVEALDEAAKPDPIPNGEGENEKLN